MIGFRLDEESYEMVTKRAEQMGVSPHTYSRATVLNALYEKQEVAALQNSVEELHQKIFALREELALIAEALLTSAGKIADKDAKRWVDENIKPA